MAAGSSVAFQDDFDQEAFDKEMANVIANTAIEREWTEASGFEPFGSDEEILAASARGEAMRVSDGIGFLAIQRLGQWEPERSNPEHPFRYSPPYLRKEAAQVLFYIAHKWARTLVWDHRLAVTSMARSLPYQQRLGDTEGKLAISPEVGLSTHVYGLAFDIDACGLYTSKNIGPLKYLAKDPENIYSPDDMDVYDRFIAANPRMDTRHTGAVVLGHEVLLEILDGLVNKGQINVAEEFAGTTNNCFHVAVNPLALAY